MASLSTALRNDYAYSPYGEATALGPDGGNSLQFTGRENDGTGQQFNRGRYYDPVLKRWLNEDPIGIAGGLNLYRYVAGNPISYADPSGLDLTVTFYPGFAVDHIGIGVNSPVTYGLYPKERGPTVPLGKDVPGVISNDQYVQDATSRSKAQTIIIKTTPSQDEFVRQYVEDARNKSAQRNSPIAYNLYSQQCTRFVIDALSAGGVRLPRFDSVRPKDLFDLLQQTNGSQN